MNVTLAALCAAAGLTLAACAGSPPTPAQRFVTDVRAGPAATSTLITSAEANGGILQLGVAACQDLMTFNDPARYYPALPPGPAAERGERYTLIRTVTSPRRSNLAGTSWSQAAAVVDTAIRDLCPGIPGVQAGE